jgi:hypothetical protein
MSAMQGVFIRDESDVQVMSAMRGVFKSDECRAKVMSAMQKRSKMMRAMSK